MAQRVKGPSQQKAAVEEKEDFVEVKEEGPSRNLRAVTSRMGRGFTAAGKGGGVVTVRMVYIGDLSSDGAGALYLATDVYTGIVQQDPDWSNLISVFDQYRVVSVGVTYAFHAPSKPDVADNTINGRTRPFVVAYDPTDSATPSSETTVWTIGTAKVGNTAFNGVKNFVWRNAAQQPIWYSTSGTTNPLVPACSIKFASDGNLGVSKSVGKAYYHAIVHFRARK